MISKFYKKGISLRKNFATTNPALLKLKYENLSNLVSKVTTNKDQSQTTLTLVRHGQSYGNLEDMIYGYLDFNLTNLGEKQCLNI